MKKIHLSFVVIFGTLSFPILGPARCWLLVLVLVPRIGIVGYSWYFPPGGSAGFWLGGQCTVAA